MAVGGVLVRQLGTNAGATQVDPATDTLVLTDNGVGSLPSYKVSSVPIVVRANMTLPTDRGWVIPQSLTIALGVTLTIAAGAVVQIDAMGAGAGTGTVTHTGTLTSGQLIQGNGGADITVNATTATVAKLTAGVPSAASAGTDYTDAAFKTISVSGQSDVVADSAADTLTLAAGSNITITTNAGTDTITIAAAGAGSGTVTNTGTLTDHGVIVGNGGVDVSALALATDTNQVLHGGVSADPTWEMPAVPISLSVASTVATGTGWVVPESLTIAAGGSLTIASGAVVEVVGPEPLPVPAEVWITTTRPSGIPSFTWNSLGSYTHLKILFSAVSDAAATSVLVNVQFNGDTGNNYDRQFVNAVNTTVTGAESLAQASTSIGVASAANATAGNVGVCNCTIFDYRGTTFNKSGVAVFQYKTSNASGNFNVRQNAVSWRSNAAITSITVSLASGNFVAGSLFSLYGVN